jgi:hypothetical protein
VEDNHDKQDDKVLVDGQGQADENGVENDAELEDCDADELGMAESGPVLESEEAVSSSPFSR